MKIKESEIKNSKIHALVYINPLFFLVVEACITWRYVRNAVIPVIMLFSTGLFEMQLYPLLCCFPRATRLQSLSLHPNTFNQFQIRFKMRLHD